MSPIDTCQCGHLQGEHKSSGPGSFAMTLRFGVCLDPECGCREYQPDEETRARHIDVLSRAALAPKPAPINGRSSALAEFEARTGEPF